LVGQLTLDRRQGRQRRPVERDPQLPRQRPHLGSDLAHRGRPLPRRLGGHPAQEREQLGPYLGRLGQWLTQDASQHCADRHILGLPEGRVPG
jgi:hypothetical protein